MDPAKPIKYTVYCHTHIESGRRYIGLTRYTVAHRWNQHCVQAKQLKKRGLSHFANAIRQYGKDAFSHEVLEVCDDLESANAAEQKWIGFHDTRNPKKGFNLAPGGGHTPHPVKNPWDRPEYRAKCATLNVAALQTPEARAKNKAALNTPESKTKRSQSSTAVMAKTDVRLKVSKAVAAALSAPESRAKRSAVFKGKKRGPLPAEVREKIRVKSTGRTHTEQSKEKMRLAQLGRKRPADVVEKTARAVRRYELSGATVEKLCAVHGVVTGDGCYVWAYANGNPRVACKACRQEMNKRRRR